MHCIFVFAHPDDETFSCAGTIALLSKKGVRISLVTATRGEKGERGNPPITSRNMLGAVREKELRNAARILGIERIHFLNYIDGELPNVSLVTLGKKISSVFEAEKPDIVVTFNREGGSRHPDHIHIHRATVRAFAAYAKEVKKHVRLYFATTPRSNIKKLEKEGIAYSAFGRIKGVPNAHVTTAVNISKTLHVKKKAITCHKTQHQDGERYLKRGSVIDLNFEFFTLASENALI